MSDGADFRQQQEQEEMLQWYLEYKQKFNEIFEGEEDEHSEDTSRAKSA